MRLGLRMLDVGDCVAAVVGYVRGIGCPCIHFDDGSLLEILFLKRRNVGDTDSCCDCRIWYLGAGRDGSCRWEEQVHKRGPPGNIWTYRKPVQISITI